MKTHKCRPLLIENKDTPNIGNIVKSKFRDVHILTKNDGKEYVKTVVKQQLILISLEDEKIEVGDKFYDEESKTIGTSFGIMNGLIIIKENSNVGCNPDFCSKVIATQEQMPPEYIQQFIEEYNKGEVKDVEIEMDTKMITKEEPDYFNYDDGTKLNPNFFKPKLINGFITIVEKETNLWWTSHHPKSRYKMIMRCYPNYTGPVTSEMIEHIQSVFDKPHIKPIIYTEEDTKKYLEIIRRFKNHCNDTSWPSESFRKKVIKMLEKK